MHLLGTQLIRTTAYHLITSGLVECFHCHLKSALQCLPDHTTHWTKTLSLVLLGIHTTPKQDLKCTSAELAYGTTLRLPGEFVTNNNHTDTLNASSYVTQLKTVMKNLCPAPVRQQQQRKTHISTDLSTCP